MPLESFRAFKTISRSPGLPHWPPPATSKGSQQPSSTSVPLGSHQLLPHIPYQGPIPSRAGQEDDGFLHREMKKTSHLHQILEIPHLSLKAPAQYLYMYVYACVSSFCRAAGARGAQADLSKAHTPRLCSHLPCVSGANLHLHIGLAKCAFLMPSPSPPCGCTIIIATENTQGSV